MRRQDWCIKRKRGCLNRGCRCWAGGIWKLLRDLEEGMGDLVDISFKILGAKVLALLVLYHFGLAVKLDQSRVLTHGCSWLTMVAPARP